jgi:hypothetical protein
LKKNFGCYNNLIQQTKLRPKQKRRLTMILAAFAVPIANGNRYARAVGYAITATHPSIFITVAAPRGIPLARVANALVANISGSTRFVCPVINGQSMMTGMLKEISISQS